MNLEYDPIKEFPLCPTPYVWAWNAGGNLSTGLLWNHLVLEAAWHHTATDGYVRPRVRDFSWVGLAVDLVLLAGLWALRRRRNPHK